MRRSELGAILGVIASVIGIITFLTGSQSIREFIEDVPFSGQPQPILEPPINSIPPTAPVTQRVVANPKEAVVHTTAGIITLRLLTDRSPEHVARFAALAGQGFYDAVEFRRAVPGVLVEASYRSDNPPSGDYQRPELSDLPFRRGVVGISTSGNPLRESWRFFIVTATRPT